MVEKQRSSQRKFKQVTNKQRRKKTSLHAKKNEEKQRKQLKRLQLFENGLVVFLLLVCVLFLVKMKTHIVDGESMWPTLENGDRILVMKKQMPKRYDIITLDPETKQDDSYVKRVIGLPGDSIVLQGNHLFLNEQMNRFSPDELLNSSKLPDSTSVFLVQNTVAEQLKELTEIPQDAYFVLGDNRNHSSDSRAFGLIKKSQIEGVVVARYYPFTRLGRIP